MVGRADLAAPQLPRSVSGLRAEGTPVSALYPRMVTPVNDSRGSQMYFVGK